MSTEDLVMKKAKEKEPLGNSEGCKPAFFPGEIRHQKNLMKFVKKSDESKQKRKIGFRRK
jgi:hypothetical protein